MVLADATTTVPDGLTAIITSLIPIVLGGVATHFKLFLPAKEEFRRRTQLKKADLKEKVAIRLSTLVQHIRELAPDDCLRGDGREQPDLVADYTEEHFRAFTIVSRLSVLDAVLKYAYLILYGCIVVGLVGLFLAWLCPVARPEVLWVAIIIVGIQIVVILVALLASHKLDEYEDIA